MIKTKHLFLGLCFLTLQSSLCPAQEARQNETATSADAEAFEWYNNAANSQDPELLLKVMWYVGPSPRTYQVMELFATGMAYSRTVLVNWSTRGLSSGVLKPAQVREIRRMLEDLRPIESSFDAQAQQHLTLVVLKDGQDTRSDYTVAFIPPDVEGIIKKVQAGIDAAPLWPNRNAKPWPQSATPCDSYTTGEEYLEAMPQKELLEYAGRRSLLPPDRYRAMKCYLQRFPDDEQGFVKMMKSWVERYEKGGN